MSPCRLPKFLVAFLCFVMACSDVPATNPYDPTTPADQQATTTVRGRAVLPSDFEAARFGAAVARLAREDARESDVRTAPLNSLGEFVFEDVVRGSYGLTLSV